eukprot:TRINITY_DN19222_c0_g1_i1.p1 TRINITY_DN19222_c0_g1~~TRINITY_DN19222_c0_g1_i1.p1  ORF type:complete len:492 (+),score=110.92 TRINITY_DN19222_c0_g1_i1:1-1476(+)
MRWLENMVGQLKKMQDAAKVVEEKKLTEVPKEFTPPKYRVKAMPKLNAKKTTVKTVSAAELEKLKSAKEMDIKEPLLVTNATSLFATGDWEEVRKHWTASRISESEYVEREFRLEYWAPDQARARLVGNAIHYQEPAMIPFSRWLVNCFHGTPAKPKLPGQNTEHCEQTVLAQDLVQNTTELKPLGLFRKLTNALPGMEEFRRRFIEAAGDELKTILGKGLGKWKRNSQMMSYRFFTFGPSGSGANLHAENGLPFFDVLIHGSKRWLLLQEDEMQRVAQKAREALEFDKTSAYMFFEEKLPELKEEFGLKKYVEINQKAGDVVIVPSGWYRVSLSLADSISYYETVMSKKETLTSVTDNQVWQPGHNQFQLAYCYKPSTVDQLPGAKGNANLLNWLKGAVERVTHDEAVAGILTVMLFCGSTLALDKQFPQFNVHAGSVCTPQVWKQCRTALAERLKEKKNAAALAWLPTKAPKSAEDLQKVDAASAKSEL